MRNDVKLGFAIGGVLLAVLIVYVLVVPGGSNNPKQTRLDNSAKKAEGGKVTLVPVPATQASAPPAAPQGEFTPGAPIPASPLNEVAMDDTAEKAVDPTPPAKSKEIDWNKLLNGQELIAQTPVSAGNTQPLLGGAEPKSAPVVPPAPEYHEIVHTPGGGVTIYPPPEAIREPIAKSDLEQHPATRPSGVTFARTHKVQSNETLSSISAAAYGSVNYWPAIVKANPGLDPNRMKVGQTLNLPEISTIKSADPQSASARIGPSAAAAIDVHTQYRVEAGDSLHKISIKLYGKSLLADRIYEMNKQMIGEDPARLKPGQVLKLPEPPTLPATR